MYLQKRYTIGKVFRRRKGIYKEDKNSKDESFNYSYKKLCVDRGLILNGVSLATFYLKNGLPYRGLKATQNIQANQILITVPKSLIITTRTAYISELQKMFEKHADFFLQHEEWEEHILMAFILHEKRKDVNSIWYEFINQLPNDIDLPLFWSDQKLALLQDPVLVKKIKMSLKMYLEAENQFFQIMHASPQEFRWAYTNLHTRDFGCQMKYKCLVPFCEYFNHECVDVHIAFRPNTQKHQFDPKQYTEEDLLSIESSFGSDDSLDLDQDIYDFEDCLEDIFLDQALSRVQVKEAIAEHLRNLPQLRKTQKHKRRSEKNHKPTNWVEVSFQKFLMKCQNTEQFQAGAQVYFNYGRLSNRELMLRYGIALEYNKYDHVYLRVEYENYLSSSMKGMCSKSQISFKLKYTSFPINLIRFCKAIQALKSKHWDQQSILFLTKKDKEIDGLNFALKLLSDFKSQFKENLGESEKLLSDKNLGYDEYFALIYRLERQRIIKHNIMLVNIAKRLLQQGGGLTCNQIWDFETSHEVQTNRILLKPYFESMRS